MSSLKNKFQWTQKFFWLLIRKILIWTFQDYESSWSKKSTPIQPRGVIGAPPYYVFSKDAILGSVPSISSEVLDLGFLTGYESKVMNDAHVESIMILATPFRENRVFDYGNQEVTSRTHELIQVIKDQIFWESHKSLAHLPLSFFEIWGYLCQIFMVLPKTILTKFQVKRSAKSN